MRGCKGCEGMSHLERFSHYLFVLSNDPTACFEERLNLSNFLPLHQLCNAIPMSLTERIIGDLLISGCSNVQVKDKINRKGGGQSLITVSCSQNGCALCSATGTKSSSAKIIALHCAVPEIP